MQQPKFVIVCGANGTGKTTFVREYRRQNKPIDYLSADEIAAKNGLDRSTVKISDNEAGRDFLRQLKESIAARNNMIVESTLSGITFERHLAQAKALGYEIELIYLFSESPAVCNDRIQQRVKKGGHFIPPEIVIKRFYKSLARFWQTYRKLASHWELHYNNHLEPSRFVLVAQKGRGDLETEEIDSGLFQKFLRIKDENQ